MKKHPYTYSVLRYVHDISRGEFVNVGVVLTSSPIRFAGAILRADSKRVSKVFPGVDGVHFHHVISMLQKRFDGISERMMEGLRLDLFPANALDFAQMVLAKDDSAFQWSPMGSGLSADPEKALASIVQQMVDHTGKPHKTGTRTDEAVWSAFRKSFREASVLQRLQPKVLSVPDDEIKFSHAWKNEAWHCMEAVSFDLAKADAIKDKAHTWLGRINSIKDASESFRVIYLVGAPQNDRNQDVFEQALNLLHKTPVPHEIVREHEASEFASEVAREMAEHDAGIDSNPMFR